MRRDRRSAGIYTGLLCALALTACAVVDRFSDRATAYNVEAEKARSQGLLLNIIRSAYRKPLQFTDLATVTGQASASGGFGTVLPLGGPRAGFQIDPTSMLSGGPTFNVATLNTKEFYFGILSPLPTQIVAFYMHEGYPRKLVLTLFASKITITENGHARTSFNRVTSADRFQKFQDMLDDLINAV